MDAQQARESLNEVKAREHQAIDEARRKGSPWWYIAGVAAVFMAISVGNDLDELVGTGWAVDVFFDYLLPLVGLVFLWRLGVALHRSIGIRLHRSCYHGRAGAFVLGLMAAFLVIYVGLSSVLRLYGVPWNSTIAGAAAALVFVVGSLFMRRTALAQSQPASTQQRAE